MLKRPAKPGPRPAPKRRAEKRRRVDDPAPEAAPGPDEAQSSSDEGMVQGIRLICMLATMQHYDKNLQQALHKS